MNMKNLYCDHSFGELMRDVSEIASYLWTKGWAERNGGNISINITEHISKPIKNKHSHFMPLGITMDSIYNNYFYVTATGKRMRDVAKSPIENGVILKINDDGSAYEIISDNDAKPTSELPSHLLIHNHQKSIGNNNKAILHTHVTELIGLSHCPFFTNSENLTNMLWSMIPECKLFVPRGIGVVPYEMPGTIDLAIATIKELDNHDAVLWEKHGLLTVGDNIINCFDTLDTLNKAAQIYLSAKIAGFEY